MESTAAVFQRKKKERKRSENSMSQLFNVIGRDTENTSEELTKIQKALSKIPTDFSRTLNVLCLKAQGV